MKDGYVINHREKSTYYLMDKPEENSIRMSILSEAMVFDSKESVSKMMRSLKRSAPLLKIERVIDSKIVGEYNYRENKLKW